MPSKDLFICFSDGVKPFQIQIITSGFLSICHYEKKNIVIFFLEILVDQTPIIVWWDQGFDRSWRALLIR